MGFRRKTSLVAHPKHIPLYIAERKSVQHLLNPNSNINFMNNKQNTIMVNMQSVKSQSES